MKNLFATGLLLFLVFASGSCSKMNDLHEKYLQGEVVYAARVDSVSVAPGNNRVQLDIRILAQRIDKVNISWENNEKSKELSIGNQIGVFSITLDDVTEGEYLFNIVSYDRFNNKSLPYEFTVITYGDIFQSTLLNRRIESIGFESGMAKIFWRAPMEGVKESLFRYTTNNDGTGEIIIPASEYETLIPDFKSGGEYSFTTFYLPQSNAIDAFESAETTGFFPAYEFKPDKSLFRNAKLPNDEDPDYGWVMENLWDNNTGTGFHTAENTGIPFPKSITFDMGIEINMLRFKYWQRQGFEFRRGQVKKFEIWGSAEYDQTGDWDKWNLLATFESVKPSGLPFGEQTDADYAWAAAGEEFTFPPNLPSVRWIRIRVLSTWEEPVSDYFNMMEIEIVGDDRL